MANENSIYSVYIDGIEIGHYSDYSFIYKRSYLKEPVRTNGGVIKNLNSYDTINVPQLSFSFRYMTIERYRQLMNLALNKNEFVVQCYDFASDQVVTENMYFEPKNLAKIFLKSEKVGAVQAVKELAILDESWNMVGTNSDLRIVNVTFNANGGQYVGEGNPDFSAVYSKIAVTPPSTDYAKSGKTFIGFNTKADGTGNFYPCNWEFTLTNNLTLYAQYV